MRKNNTVFIILGTLSCLNILAWSAIYDFSKPKILEVTFFNIGQGDSIFIETPGRHQILIDGGPDSKIFRKIRQRDAFF